MALINWTEKFNTNIPTIDFQHKKLVNLINDFYQNIRNRSNDENIATLIEGMKNYLIMHFKTEEEFMQSTSYPNYKLHKMEHDSFIAKVANLEEKFKSGQLILSFEITDFLKTWIKDHILGTDMQYINHFIKNGIK